MQQSYYAPGAISANGPPLANSMARPMQAGQRGGRVALLLPLSGPLASIGQSMEQAAKLAFAEPSAPKLDVRDTGGTPAGAAQAAQAAIAAGDGIILGPLTKDETAAVAPIAQKADVNVLAFTNDETLDAPGLWTLGISPGQQVRRVISFAAQNGRTRTAAVLPENAFGQIMAAALRDETQHLGEPAPQIGFYQSGNFSSLTATVRSVSDFNGRGAGLEARMRAARDQDNQAGRILAAKLSREPIPPPPFDTLLLAATGEQLAEMGTLLPYFDVGAPAVQLAGPMLWAQDATSMATHDGLRGAIYAAPDPALRAAFVQKFEAANGGGAPPTLDDVAFDGAAIAVLAAHEGGFTTQVLTNPTGFLGTDGVLVLLDNGQVRRGLAVFKVTPGGPTIISPAPLRLTTPTG